MPRTVRRAQQDALDGKVTLEPAALDPGAALVQLAVPEQVVLAVRFQIVGVGDAVLVGAVDPGLRAARLRTRVVAAVLARRGEVERVVAVRRVLLQGRRAVVGQAPVVAAEGRVARVVSAVEGPGTLTGHLWCGLW